MKLLCSSLIFALAFPVLSSAQIPPSTEKGPDFFGPEVRLNLNPAELVTVEEDEEIVPGSAPINVDADKEMPPRPESHILDEARVFSDEQFQQLSARLKDPSHGIEFYVTAHTILPAESLEEYALKIRDAWAQTDTCIVFCYQRGTQLMTMCSSDGVYQFLPKPELARSYQKAYAAAGEHDDAAGRLIIAVETFLTDVSNKITSIKENAVVFDRGIIKILVALFTALIVAGIIGLFMARLQKRASMKSSTTYQFPLLAIPNRFGAPFGGGTIAEVVFEEPGQRLS